jgi:hypothetical protein
MDPIAYNNIIKKEEDILETIYIVLLTYPEL